MDDINHFFLLDDLPYEVTKFIRETRIEEVFVSNHEVLPREEYEIVGYPKIICREDQVTHSFAIQPTINLLSDKRFTSANQEFLAALEDYRKRDYGDCLTKCGSAFESTMKIICDQKSWMYNPNDTASTLLNIILNNSTLDNFFIQPLTLVATLRNKLSTAHGSGIQQRNVPEHIAKYTINATASAILLLIEECL